MFRFYSVLGKTWVPVRFVPAVFGFFPISKLGAICNSAGKMEALYRHALKGVKGVIFVRKLRNIQIRIIRKTKRKQIPQATCKPMSQS